MIATSTLIAFTCAVTAYPRSAPAIAVGRGEAKAATSEVPFAVQRTEVDWRLLKSGASFRERRTRIYYIRTRKRASHWLPYLETPSDRQALTRVNFRRFGVLLIFHRAVPATISLDAVSWVPHGLKAELTLTPWSPPPCSSPPCTPPPMFPPSDLYVLATIRKASLPGHVRLLYISEVTSTD